jgi:PAS domain S-box-containing protein
MSAESFPNRTTDASPALPTTLGSQQRDLADAMPHIVWTDGPDGKPTYFNRKWTEYTGLELEQTVQVGAHTLIHPDDLPEVVRVFGEARARGIAFTTTYRLRRARDGAYRWHEARVVPLHIEGGRVSSFVGTAVDIDDQRRVNYQQQFLAAAGKVLGTSLEPARTLSDVARLVVPHLADWCAIDLVKEEGGFERLAVAHVDPAKVALAQELWRRWPPKPEDPQGLYAVVRTRRAVLFEDIPDALLVASIPDPELLALFRSLGMRSSMCVPLIARDRALGALSLVTAESGRHYGTEDLAFAHDFASRIAVAIDNARLYTEAQQARRASEALTADVVEQSKGVEAALLAMRAERDEALAKLARLEQAQKGSSGRP